jgi:predicted RNA-binding protein (TIGR00451 family)
MYSLYPGTPDLFGEEDLSEEEDHPGIPRVMISEDAIPFVGDGRNVMHGYILGADSHTTPGQPCVVVSQEGELIAHGVPTSTSLEMTAFKKGIAVKVRDGCLKE